MGTTANLGTAEPSLDQAGTRIQDDPRWHAVQRIVASSSFARSVRLSSFLLYVCEKEIAGCTDEITEQQIGVNVFARASDYNPGDDNIVRGVARQLRQRLALYYQEDGIGERLRISIPRGGYVPVFETLIDEERPSLPDTFPSVDLLETEAEPRIAAAAVVKAATPWARIASFVGLFLLGVISTVLVQFFYISRSRETPTSPLWHALFTPNRRTIVVAGDAGLNMFSNLARRKVAVAEYDSRAYLNSPFAETPKGYTWTPFVRRDYTSFADVMLISKLVLRPEVVQDRLDIRFARNLSMEDLKEPNVILIGSENYDPWVRLFQNDLNFHLVWDGETNSTVITNSSPHAGEQAIYQVVAGKNEERHTGYALIDFVSPSKSGRKVMIIEGTTMLGIHAATDFLSDEADFGKVVQNARQADGGLKGFEVLLQSDFVDGNTQNTHVIATRFTRR